MEPTPSVDPVDSTPPVTTDDSDGDVMTVEGDVDVTTDEAYDDSVAAHVAEIYANHELLLPEERTPPERLWNFQRMTAVVIFVFAALLFFVAAFKCPIDALQITFVALGVIVALWALRLVQLELREERGH